MGQHIEGPSVSVMRSGAGAELLQMTVAYLHGPSTREAEAGGLQAEGGLRTFPNTFVTRQLNSRTLSLEKQVDT